MSSLPLDAPSINVENDENDPWNECRELFEPHRSHMLNSTSADKKNYYLRHSSANTSLNESTSLDALTGHTRLSIDGNHDELLSIIEQAGITFGSFEQPSQTMHSSPV